MCGPKIAVGPDNKLYVTYTYNASTETTSRIHMQILMAIYGRANRYKRRYE